MMTAGRVARLLLVLLVALAPRSGHSATVAAASLTFTVNSTADAPDANPGDGICADSSGQCTLRAAIQEADAQPTGSRITIDVPAGTYGLTLGTLQLTANVITVSGALSSTTIISGNNTSTIMSISSSVQAHINQVTLTGGYSGAGGGGLVNAGRTILNQSTVISNTAGFGGGIFNKNNGRLSLEGSTLRGNSVGLYGNGGGIYNTGALTLTTCTLSNNMGNGGGIYNQGALRVTTCTVTNNLVHS